jgi:hypothetical protein
LAVIGSAAAMTRNGMRCWVTGTMAAVLPESKEPINICPAR